MAFYDFNYKFFGLNNLAKDYRTYPDFIKIFFVTLEPIRWYWYNFMSLFVYGLPAVAKWDSSISYSNEAVIKYNDSLYVSLVSQNIGNVPYTSPNKWLLIMDNIIGYLATSKYTPNLIMFEYILNMQFGGIFKQMGEAGGDSDIKVLRNSATNENVAYISRTGLLPARIGRTNSNLNISRTGIFTSTTNTTSITLKLNPAIVFDTANILKFAYKFATVGITINIQYK